MNRKYKGGGCGCGGTPRLIRGGQNNNNSNGNNNNSNSNNSNNNNSKNNNSNSGGLMNAMKGFFGGQNMANGQSEGKQVPTRKMRQQQQKQQQQEQPMNGVNYPVTNGTMKKQPLRRMKKQSRSNSIPAKQITFSNGTSLEGQVSNMQQNLNSITGKKKMKKRQMYGGQNNNSLATLHNKVNALANTVDNINANKGNNNSNNMGLFGGSRPMANVFLEKQKNGGGIFENIGSLFGMNKNSSKNVVPNAQTSVEPINTTLEEQEIVATPPVKNSSLPDPASVVNKPVVEAVEEEQEQEQMQPTGGKFINSLFGGYRATKRNRKYLRNYKKGKSIRGAMRSSLKTRRKHKKTRKH